MNIDNLEKQAEEALISCLRNAPGISLNKRIEPIPFGAIQPDLLYSIKNADFEQLLVVEIGNNGQPKPVREVVNQLVRIIQWYKEKNRKVYGIIVAPYISETAASICKEASVGYIDLVGNCYISFGTVYIRVEGRPNSFRSDRKLKSFYSPKASRILRVLLESPVMKEWKMDEMSKEADVSVGLVFKVKKLLDEREWIYNGEQGFSLSDPDNLLRDWSENYSFRKNKARDFYSLLSVSELETNLATACRERSLKYALTGFSGASRIAPAVRYQRVMTYIQGEVEELISALELKEVPSGSNITLLEPFDEGVMYGAREIEGIWIVASVQAYLDLVSFRGRGEEAAEALLNQVIMPKWQQQSEIIRSL